jgi:hypothetical protein
MAEKKQGDATPVLDFFEKKQGGSREYTSKPVNQRTSI